MAMPWKGGKDHDIGMLVMSLAPVSALALCGGQMLRTWPDEDWKALTLLATPLALMGLFFLFLWDPRWQLRQLRESTTYTARRPSTPHLPDFLPQPSADEIETHPLMVEAKVDAAGRLLEASGISCWPRTPWQFVDPLTLPPEQADVLRALARLEQESSQVQVHHGPQRRWWRHPGHATPEGRGDYRSAGQERTQECQHLDGAYLHVALPLSAAHPTATLIDGALGASTPGAYELAPLVRWLGADPARLEAFVAMIKNPGPSLEQAGLTYRSLYLPWHRPGQAWPTNAGSMVERRAGELAAMMARSQIPAGT